MRVLAIIAIAGFLVLGFLAEKRMSLCGAGVFPVHLPYDFRVDTVGGKFWLTNQDGWGVLATGAEYEIGGLEISVEWLRRYTTEHGFVVEVELEDGETAYIELGPPVEGSWAQRALLTPAELRKRAGADLDSISWVGLHPMNCFGGAYRLVRFLIAAGLVGSLVIAFRPPKSRLVVASMVLGALFASLLILIGFGHPGGDFFDPEWGPADWGYTAFMFGIWFTVGSLAAAALLATARRLR